MDKIRMVDLQKQYLRIKKEVDDAIGGVLQSTAFIQGPQVGAFAGALEKYTGSRHVVTCGNGTDALQIAMMALGLEPGDEVMIPAHTYVATAEVIALLRLTPVFIDVDERTFNIDPRLLEKKLTAWTKAIVPVHLYGQCAHLEPVLDLARKHGLFVIEDAAQALGAEYTFSNGTRKQAGTMGTIGITSFFPTKNLGCYGDGGALFTDDEDLAEKIRMVANHGQRVKYQHEIIGVNSRLDTLQAAVLQVKLRYVDEYISRRNEVASYYDRKLSGLPLLQTPRRADYSTHTFHQYTLTIEAEQRDRLVEFLRSRDIPSVIYYPLPLHHQKAYRHHAPQKEVIPVAEKLSKTVISLPIHTEMEPAQLEFICDAIKQFIDG